MVTANSPTNAASWVVAGEEDIKYALRINRNTPTKLSTWAIV